jgi:iron complex outermembrane recepter protein
MKQLLSIVFALFLGATLAAQTTVTGTVKDAKSGESLPGVSIKVVGKSLGTTTDFDGNFTLKVLQNPPFKVEASYIGYTTQTLDVNSNSVNLDISLKEESSRLDEVIVSASRTPESVRESPVTVERFDIRDIKNTASVSFYDGLENLKGVQLNTNSLTFKSVNTRGFATFANTRFVQLVDGMDNAAPALNFVMGNLVGMSELDVKSIELLPGASSALYGANAFNGILFMTSKSPFDYQGASFYAKSGLTHQRAQGTNEYWDAGVRFAHAFSDKFAAKASFSFLTGTDWEANDYTDVNNPNNPTNAPDYDGLNVYGDEVATTLDFDAIAAGAGILLPPGFLGSAKVARTGYKERDLMDYRAESAKADLTLVFRPNADDLEVVYQGKIGTGNTMYQGANRYSLKNFLMQQHKIEVHSNNFFVRAYVVSEDAGNSYDSRFTAINMNRSFKSDTQWFTEYAQTYLGGKLGLITGSPMTDAQAHATARIVAQTGIPEVGSAAFNSAFDKVTNDPSLLTGSKFIDATKMYQAEGNYNFKDLTDVAEIQIGGSWREFQLNSAGTIFTDTDGPIVFSEYGAYLQVAKKLMDDKLKFTGSIRYDKSKNFDGNYSPRLSLVYSAGDRRQHNFRASFQTGFRNPDTQSQYIGLDVGNALLVGSAPDNLDRYTSRPYNVSTLGQAIGMPATLTVTGRQGYENAFTLESVLAGAPQKANTSLVQPEKITAYELGYRGTIGNVSIDLSGYYNDYTGFIAQKTVLAPLYGKADFSDFVPGTLPAPPAAIALSQGDFVAFSTYTNSKADITSYGVGLGISAKLFEDYDFTLNYSYSKFNFDQASDPGFEAGFNTPENSIKISIGNTDIIKNVGFNLSMRYFDSYLWQASFGDGTVPSATVFDGQLTYNRPKINAAWKLGANNLTANEYTQAYGTGMIGEMIYLSFTINP